METTIINTKSQLMFELVINKMRLVFNRKNKRGILLKLKKSEK